ncbi:MAG: leucine--tRNA ligase [Bdellovibrionota bacterium]
MNEPGFDPSKPKYYVLDMFPYPSGVGLHVGHPLGYIASDIVARFKRMQGFNVLHPMGFDAFGLPAEQFAIETGTHPEITTKNNIENMRKQLKACALSYDWSREISTIDTEYYKWTQWIFLKLFNSYFDEKTQKAQPIENLIQQFEKDPSKSWTSLSRLEQENILSTYRLAYMKEVTVNWCPGLGTVLANEEVTNEGRSERGNFPVFKRPLKQWMLRITAYADRLIQDLNLVDWPDAIKQMQTHWIGKSEGGSVLFSLEKNPSQKIEVFTTRPDTLMGATFLALAPQHPLVASITTPENKKDVEAIAHATPDDEKKSGAFTGAYAIHPVTGKQVPIWVASYILMDYGTGAIMAVPAHDQRDYEFANQYKLPIVQVVQSSEKVPANQAFEGEGRAINSDFLDGLKTSEAKQKMIAFLKEKKVGASQIQYKLRDWLFSRQRYWGEPFPILHHPDGYPVAIAEKELPVTLPPLKDFKPTASDDPNAQPQPSLGRAEENWKTVKKDGVVYQRELNTMPNWAGSCWYYLRFIDPRNKETLISASEEKYWMGKNGVDLYIGGVEHAVLHLLYARFWHKVLFDLGFVSTNEPFGKLFNQGYIQAYSYQDERGMYVDATKIKEVSPGKFEYEGKPVTRNLGKMGKSLKNSISPDEVIETYGCDTFRLYEMYLGPLEQSKTWDTEAIVGVNRFLQRAWRNLVSENGDALLIDQKNSEGKLKNLLHQTIFDVTKMMSDMRFNAAIAKLIELNNELVALEKIPSDVAKAFVLMLAPFAPHMCEEIWKRMGHTTSVAYAPWPTYEEAALKKARSKS